jgi:hypothetical protein
LPQIELPQKIEPSPFFSFFWFFFLIAAAGGWLVNIIFHIFSKNPLGLAMNLVGIGVVFLALIITAKDFLGKKSS